jgi:tRNA(fMet)-specific endonuclease VapC
LLVLDTDHFSELTRESAAGKRLTARLEAAGDDHAITIITVEEQMRGWLAEINRRGDLNRQIFPYAKIQRQVELYGSWIILPWDAEAAASFARFRTEGIRIGSLDLKIACIALAHDVTLLTRNTSDSAQVPGLRFENWLA